MLFKEVSLPINPETESLRFPNHSCRLDLLDEPCRCCGYHCRICNQRFAAFRLAAIDRHWSVCFPNPPLSPLSSE